MKVNRDDLHPKVKTPAKVWAGVMLAGVVGSLTAAQHVSLSPLATVGIAGALGLLQLLAGFLQPGDGR